MSQPVDRPPAGGGVGGQQQQPAGNKRIEQAQAQVNEVTGIMRANLDRILERDQRLGDIDARADNLNAGAHAFSMSASSLKRKYWWKNIKMMIIIGAVVLILLVILIIWVTN